MVLDILSYITVALVTIFIGLPILGQAISQCDETYLGSLKIGAFVVSLICIVIIIVAAFHRVLGI